MNDKNIVLYERYDGVRFVLDRSLSKYKEDLSIHASHWKHKIKQLIDTNEVDLLITELSRIDPVGLEVTQYAKKSNPEMKIIWITVLGCNIFREQRESLGNIYCLEKPLEINEFRNFVLKALKMSKGQEGN